MLIAKNKMKAIILFFLSVCFVKMSLAKLLEIETELNPIFVNQDQLYINRKERFIKFDTKENELDIELGISVPFIKVPLHTKKEMFEERNTKITINAPGVLIAGILMFTSFIIVPFIFTSTDKGFTFQRKDKRDIWSVVDDMNNTLYKNGLNSSSCMQKSICWIAKSSKGGKDGSVGKWVNKFLNNWLVNRLIGGTFIEEAVESASNDSSCGAKFSHCSLTNKHLQSFMKIVAGMRG